MKHFRNIVLTALVLTLLSTVLWGCARSETVAELSPADAVAVIADISTTQYFTQEAVDPADVETILQAGINAPSAMNSQPWHFSVITDKEILQQIAGDMGGGMPSGGMPEGMPEGFEGGMPEGMPEGFEGGMPEGMPEGFEGAPPEGGRMPGGPAGGSGTAAKAGIADAPLVIVISCSSGSELDAGIACQNMSAAAQLLGYGTKIISSPTMALNGTNRDTYRSLLGIPSDQYAVAVLLVGRTDPSVTETADGTTGATPRSAMEEMVTYID